MRKMLLIFWIDQPWVAWWIFNDGKGQKRNMMNSKQKSTTTLLRDTSELTEKMPAGQQLSLHTESKVMCLLRCCLFLSIPFYLSFISSIYPKKTHKMVSFWETHNWKEKELQKEAQNITTTGNLNDGMPPGGNEKSLVR